MNNQQYRNQVALLIRIMPLVYKVKDFAVHGGTAINLFHQNMLRYSVDIDLTYIPIEPREESLLKINQHLQEMKIAIERAIPKIQVLHKPDVWKLQCLYDGAIVKIEVNGTKRGILGEAEVKELSPKAKEEFQANCKARIVPYSQLYGGKIVAALSRQHPRDMFDCKYMKDGKFESVKEGLFLCLLGSDKPIIESLCPNLINQEKALENQFKGMSAIPFSYIDYLQTRSTIIKRVEECLTKTDREFLVTFEEGTPQWEKCCAGDLNRFPSIQWKLLNINKLKAQTPKKHQEGISKLKNYLQV
jgi:hypothetical protein